MDQPPFGIAIPLDALKRRMEEAPKKLTATPLAQAMDLSLAWQRVQEDAHLQPGDLAQEREGLGMFPDNPVLIIWRLLDIKDPHDLLLIKDAYRRSMLSRIDCLVARKVEEDGAIVMVPHDLSLLEPYTGPREKPRKPKAK